jgi:deoxycytidylate deaminase
MKTTAEAIKESTCQKRVVVCELYGADNVLLARESNRCSPEGGICHRLGLSQSKENYDKESSCNWTHAEINALNSLPQGATPYRAVIHGHSFFCDACQEALGKAGVKVFEII